MTKADPAGKQRNPEIAAPTHIITIRYDFPAGVLRVARRSDLKNVPATKTEKDLRDDGLGENPRWTSGLGSSFYKNEPSLGTLVYFQSTQVNDH